MPTAPSGPISLVEQRLKVLLANSATWQTWTGSANATAALDTIYLNALPKPAAADGYALDELQTYRPFAVIATDEAEGFAKAKFAEGSSFSFDESGRMTLTIEADIAAGDVDDDAEASMKFKNNLGNVLAEIAALAGTEGTIEVDGNPMYLRVTNISVDAGPYRSDEDQVPTEGDFYMVQIGIEWSSFG